MWSGWHSAFTHSKHWVKCQLSLLRWLQLPSGKPCSLCYASTLPNSKWTFQKEIFYFNNTFFNTLLWKDFKYVNRIQYNTQERWWGRAERDPALEAQMGIVHLIQPLSNYVTWLLKLSLNLVKGLQGLTKYVKHQDSVWPVICTQFLEFTRTLLPYSQRSYQAQILTSTETNYEGQLFYINRHEN